MGGALLPRVPRASRRRSPTCASRSRPSRGQDLGALLRRPRRAAGRGAARGRRSPTCATSTGGGFDVAGRARADAGRARRSRSTCRSSCRRTGEPVDARSCASTAAGARSRSRTEARAAGAPRRPVVRPLPPARPARDAAVDRPDLRRAEDPRGAARAGARPPSRTATGSSSRAGAATAHAARDQAPTPRSRELPKDRAVWLLGRDNALAAKLFASGGDYTLDGAKLAVDRESMPLAGHVGVIVAPPPGEPREGDRLDLRRRPAAAARPRPQAPALRQVLVPRLRGRRAGERAQGPVDGDRLAAARRPAARRPSAAPRSRRWRSRARKALAELPPVFSQKALLEHVAWLSAPEREGRGVGTKGLDAAAEYVADAVQGDRASSRAATAAATSSRSPSTKAPAGAPVDAAQRDRRPAGHEGRVGRASRRSSPRTTTTSASAGRTSTRATRASSTPAPTTTRAASRCCSSSRRRSPSGEKPQRTLVFVAFSGEEAGLLGSKHYVEHPRLPARQDDRRHQPRHRRPALRQEGLGARAPARASEWQHIFRGAGFVTGVEGRMIPDGARVLRPEELHRQGRARGADLHRPARRLPPARRHRRQDRRPRAS